MRLFADQFGLKLNIASLWAKVDGGASAQGWCLPLLYWFSKPELELADFALGRKFSCAVFQVQVQA